MDCVLDSEVRLLVFSSSCAVYGIPTDLPILESSPKEPISPYGATRIVFRARALPSLQTFRMGCNMSCLRYFNAAGSHPSGGVGEIHNPETHLIPLAIKAALGTAPPLTIFGNDLDTKDGTCVRDFVHVADIAAAHLKALEYLAGGGASTALNLGTGKGTSIAEVLEAIEKISNRRVPHVFAPPERGTPRCFLPKCKRPSRH
jgi:UDP-arabinose 4-epimerase